jgi:MFS transporter, ACS family, hexuronate transporter
MGYPRLRWIIVGLLFVSTALNYVDRQTLSILSSTLRREFQLTESDYANAVTAFLLSYTVMYSVAGRWLDRVGLRVGIVACIAWWSVATMLTAFTRGAASLAAARFLLGVGEPGIFPGGLKACAEWFPRKERALATGIFSSGSAAGAVIAPPLIAWIALEFGWREAFLVPGILGLLWIPLWLHFYRPLAQHPEVSAEHRAMLTAESLPGRNRKWSELLRQRKVWGVVLPRFLSDSVWYFYLFWLPDYLQRERHLSLAEIGFYGWIPFLFADVGSIGGGALSDWLIRRGWAPVQARFTLLAAVGMLSPVGALVGIVPQVAAAIGVTCMIACLTQVWSTNTATLAADLFAPDERATVLGMMGTAGSLGGVLFSQSLAVSIASFGYASAFMIAAVLHPIAALTMFVLLRPVAHDGHRKSVWHPTGVHGDYPGRQEM